MAHPYGASFFVRSVKHAGYTDGACAVECNPWTEASVSFDIKQGDGYAMISIFEEVIN